MLHRENSPMAVYSSSRNLEEVTQALTQLGEEFWNVVELNRESGQLMLCRNTFFRGGPLWRLRGRLEETSTGSRLEARIHFDWFQLILPFAFVGLLIVSLSGLRPQTVELAGMMEVPLAVVMAIRVLIGLGERSGIFTTLERAGFQVS